MKASSTSSRLTRRSSSLAAFATLALLPLFSGCTTTSPGPNGMGTVAYGHGELSADLTRDLDGSFASAQRALAELNFAKIDDKKSRVDAELISRTATDKKIVVKLERITDTLTKVHIRVGTLGDETLSRLILDKIAADLK